MNTNEIETRDRAEIVIPIGIQHGDEGKGKSAKEEAKNADVIIRANGGDNAGHTTVTDDGRKFALHLIPGAVANGIPAFLAPGVVIKPEAILKDIQTFADGGVEVTPELLTISEVAHVIMPYHCKGDELLEVLKTHKVGTTKKGIGPCYMEKANRTNPRMMDLLKSVEELEGKIMQSVRFWNKLFKDTDGFEKYVIGSEKVHELALEYHKYGEILRPYIKDIRPYIESLIDGKKKIVFESAQALGLDLDHGDYPMVTSSSPNPSGILSAAGIGPSNKFDIRVIGVMKAYSSRVGEGPFITEDFGEWGDKVREYGHEYGTTTGRPRRCGKTDLVPVLTHAKAWGIESLAINHVDTLGRMGIEFGGIDICISYTYKGKETTYIPRDITPDGEQPTPNYIHLNGGWKLTPEMKTFDQLPGNCKEFIYTIEEITGVPVKYIGTGPKDGDLIIK